MNKVGNQLLASILVNSIYEMKNYPVVLVNTVLSPLSFLILIFFVSGGTLLGEAILGGLIMTMFSSGTSLQADLSHLKNDFKLQDMVVGSPTNAAVYVTGMAISELIYSSPAIVILSLLFYTSTFSLLRSWASSLSCCLCSSPRCLSVLRWPRSRRILFRASHSPACLPLSSPRWHLFTIP